MNDASLKIKLYTNIVNDWSVKFDFGIPLAAFIECNDYIRFVIITKKSNFYKLNFMIDNSGSFKYSGYYYVYYI